MQTTANRHHQITCRILPQPNGIFDNPAALDRADDVLNPHTTMGNDLVLGSLRLGQFLPARLLMRHRDLHTIEREAEKAKVLQQLTPVRQRIECLVGDRLVVDTSFIGITQKWNTTAWLCQQNILYGVPLFLAAITRFLLIAIFGAGNWSFRAVVKKRDEVPGSLA